VLLVVAVLVAIACAVALSVHGRIKLHDSTILVHGNPDEVLNDIRIALAGVPTHLTFTNGPNSLAVQCSITPGWVLFVCIVFFPVGLLALLGRQTLSSTILAEPGAGDATRLRIAGRFDQRAIARINTVIEARSS
jgi:hypothetical protein